jgi:hypothetical protein
MTETDFFPPDTFEYDEFAYLFGIANAAEMRKLIMPNLEEEIGGKVRDEPLSRAIYVVLDQVECNRRKLHSFMWRYCALLVLIESGKLDTFIREPTKPGEQHLIDKRVFDVARRMALDRSGAFNAKRFRKMVEEVKQRRKEPA